MLANIEIVRAILQAFAARDVEGVLRYVHPEVRFSPLLARLTDEVPGAYVGHEGIRSYFRDMERAWPDLEINEMQIQQAGDAVVIVGSVRASATHGELRASAVWTWKIRDGLMIEGTVHSDEAPARAALGLPPEPPT